MSGVAGYDVIGDVHGCADRLRLLLGKLGYAERGGVWSHAERVAVFVGDLIDSGPQQVETVMLVRRMVDSGAAYALMGNHEFNAIAWYLPDPTASGEHLRVRFSPRWGAKNRLLHAKFLGEVEGTPLHRELIDWFLARPLWLELPGFRVVHACWHTELIAYAATRLAEGNRLTRALMVEAAKKPKGLPEPTLYGAVEALLKGPEMRLPEGYSYEDRQGIRRTKTRLRWWNGGAATFHTGLLLNEAQLAAIPDGPLPPLGAVYDLTDKPLFVGHYALTGAPKPLTPLIACVDYGAAKGGPVTAYRWDGELELGAGKFVQA